MDYLGNTYDGKPLDKEIRARCMAPAPTHGAGDAPPCCIRFRGHDLQHVCVVVGDDKIKHYYGWPQ